MVHRITARVDLIIVQLIEYVCWLFNMSLFRLYVKGAFIGFKRSVASQDNGTALLKIKNVTSRDDAKWYLGKRVAYIYRAPTVKDGSHYRAIWGRVMRPHGNSGVVRAKFLRNLPSQAMGATVRVMLYPSNI